MPRLDQKVTVNGRWRTQESDDVRAKVSSRGTGHCDQGTGAGVGNLLRKYTLMITIQFLLKLFFATLLLGSARGNRDKVKLHFNDIKSFIFGG